MAAPHAPSIPSAAAPASDFARLDGLVRGEAVAGEATYGVIEVVAPAAALGPLVRHLHRRASQNGRLTAVAGETGEVAVWRTLARHLAQHGGARGVRREAVSDDPLQQARAIAQALRGGVLVVGEAHTTAWGTALRRALAEEARDPAAGLLLVVVVPSAERAYQELVGGRRGAAVDRRLEVGGLDEHDQSLWWRGLQSAWFGAQAASDPAAPRLADLDRAWSASLLHADAPRPTPAPRAGRVAVLVAAAGQPVARELALAIAGPEALEEALAQGLVRHTARGVVGTDPALDAGRALAELGADDAEALAALLERIPQADPWIAMRAAEAWCQVARAAHDAERTAQALSRAERLALDALSAARDTHARDDLWRRYLGAIEHAVEADRALLDAWMRGAEHALSLGDADRADAMVQRALRVSKGDFAVLLLHGRSSHARGDLTTATLALSRALAAASSDAERARAAGVMAQVRFMAGDREQAKRYATEAVALGAEARTRLDGRNVIGKLLLATEGWTEAEAHFATDTYDARCAGDLEAELRARTNRSIALLYLGDLEGARAMLAAVRDDGARDGQLQAVAFALSNLATIAILRHEYADALDYSERAIEVRRRTGGRLSLVQPITNLAELRLSLGLLSEAEEGLRFGLQLCGHHGMAGGLPLSSYAYFAKAAARIHLDRGDTDAAQVEVAAAIRGASGAGERGVLAQCHRIAARIALEDGDLTRAEQALDLAGDLKHTRFGQAELAVLGARFARAQGQPFRDAATAALEAALHADDPESLREAHLLLHHAATLRGDSPAAASHLSAARQERDRVASSLPAGLRQRFLGSRRMQELAAALDGQPITIVTATPEMPAGPVTRRSRAAASPNTGHRLVGSSPAMSSLRRTVARVARTDAPVLVHGETGTGKELVAEALHHASARHGASLIKVNCAALVETLLLSELFGHEKGAFTGASSRRRGRFEMADGGTLFLDEIGDISPRTQVALLRVLQDGSFQRVGGSTTHHVDVRVVCATHRDLKAMVAEGTFREDLYYRLCGVVVEVPALKDRLADLDELSGALLERAQSESGVTAKPLSSAARAALGRHSWPGNVRELDNALRVAALFSAGPELEPHDFSEHVEGLRHLEAHASGQGESIPPRSLPGHDGEPLSLSAPRSLAPGAAHGAPVTSSSDAVYAEIRGGIRLADMKKKLEKACIARALVEAGGNITRAAGLLGMKRPRLSQLVKQYELSTVLEDIKS